MKKDFLENFFDLNNRDYDILRLINEKIHFVEQDTRILAVFGGIGKTALAEKYPNLCSDIEVAGYRYDYNNKVIDRERVKGSINRKKNLRYPNNYISKIGENFNKKALLTVVLSEEILHKLDRMGICYDIVYPKKRMKEELTRRMRLRGNNNTFIEKIEQILDDYLELDYLKRNLRINKIYYADNDDTLEDIVVREGIADELVLNNSAFKHEGVRYDVCFCPHKEGMHEEDTNFTQVYCVGIINKKALVIFHKNKDGEKIYNLPGGTREKGEDLGQNLRREIKEEANCRVIDYEILGTQINVSETGEIQKPQIRVFAHLEPFGEFRNDPGGNVEGYELVDITQIEKYIKWGEVGDWIALKVGNILKESYG